MRYDVRNAAFTRCYYEARKRKTHAGLVENTILEFSTGKLGTVNLRKRSAHSNVCLYYNRRAIFELINRLFDIADKYDIMYA